MARKGKSTEDIIAALREVEVRLGQGNRCAASKERVRDRVPHLQEAAIRMIYLSKTFCEIGTSQGSQSRQRDAGHTPTGLTSPP
jgi:hypothetical protein